MTTRLLPALLLPVLLLCLPLEARANATGPDLDEATLRLDHLKKGLSRSASPDDELLAGLDAVEASYLGLRRDVTPETEAAFAKWCVRAEKLYLKAFTLVKLDRRDKERNLREGVNVRAARILGRTGKPTLWKSVKRALETRHFSARHTVSSDVLVAGFDAIVALGDPQALTWMADEFIHTNSSPEKVVDRLVAAQQAFVRFPLERVPGRLRHAIVKKLVQLYPATEAVANQNDRLAAAQSTRRFWDRIRTGVILAAQHFAGTPRNAEGEALATMAEFREWFRGHKDARKAPWIVREPPRS